jgi:membrane fusion protein (multidrug efflux system)
MKEFRILLGIVIAAALAAGAWILVFHPDWVKGAKDDDEDDKEVMPVPTVKVGKVTRATLRRYVEGYGTVEAQPVQSGSPAASARLASPVPGIVAQVFCFQGQRVEKGTLLVQLDERSALAEEEKAGAAIASAQASLDKLKSFPRPDQIKVAEMQVDRARRAVEYSQKKNTRLVQLVADQLASEKTLQEAELELLAAQNDHAIAEKQLLLLRSTPTKEEIAEAQGKVVEAQKALAAAQVQRSLLKITSPLAGTVVRARINPGEAVDLTTVLAEIIDLGRLVVEGTVPAESLRSVTVGMDVEMRAGGEDSKNPSKESAARAATVRGKIAFVGLDIDRKTDAGSVRVILSPDAGIPPGQFVRLRIVAEEHKDHLVVPRESVVQNPEGKTCIVGFLGEKAIQKEVRAGLREGELIEIEGDEIDEGDVVVTQGAYGLPGEAKVRILKDK